MIAILLLAISCLNACALGVLVALQFRDKRGEFKIILDAISGGRSSAEQEHGTIFSLIRTANGRLQFLMAKEISEELAVMRQAAAADKSDAKP